MDWSLEMILHISNLLVIMFDIDSSTLMSSMVPVSPTHIIDEDNLQFF